MHTLRTPQYIVVLNYAMLIQKSFQVPAMTTTKVYNCVRTYISSNYYNLLHEIQTYKKSSFPNSYFKTKNNHPEL